MNTTHHAPLKRAGKVAFALQLSFFSALAAAEEIPAAPFFRGIDCLKEHTLTNVTRLSIDAFQGDELRFLPSPDEHLHIEASGNTAALQSLLFQNQSHLQWLTLIDTPSISVPDPSRGDRNFHDGNTGLEARFSLNTAMGLIKNLSSQNNKYLVN